MLCVASKEVSIPGFDSGRAALTTQPKSTMSLGERGVWALGKRQTMAKRGTRTIHYRACTLCEAICGLEVEVQDGNISAIRGDRDDPLSRGHICPKAVALRDVHEDPDRLKHPMRRTAEGWQRISWRQAFNEAGSQLRSIQRRHGRDAVATYLGNPNVHSSGSLLFGPPLLRSLGTRNRFSATSTDQLPHQLAAQLMFGHQLLIPIPDIDRTQLFLIIGGNPVVSNGSIMTAPNVKERIKAVQSRGGEVVVIDPRRTETAKLASVHHFIRPGTDALLLAAMVSTVLEQGHGAPGELGAFLDGAEALRTALDGFSPERVASVVGMEAAEIRTLCHKFCAAPSAVCYGRLGVSANEFGCVCQWLINVLNAVTGNLDRPGGAMFTRPAIDVLKRMSRGHIGRWRSRVRQLPEVAGELPAAVMAEEMLTPGPGQIRALITAAGNPVLSTPNGKQLDRGLAGLEFMVSIDFYINETTRHAHLILPPTGPLEREHYDLAFHLLAVRNTARHSRPLFDPAPGARHDWQIWLELTARLQGSGPLGRGWAVAKAKMQRALGPRPLLDIGLRYGPYGAKGGKTGERLSLGRLEKSVHGIDLGPLQPCLPQRLFTADKRLKLAPMQMLEDLARLRKSLHKSVHAGAEQDSLLLIGRRHLRSNNSWMHNSPRLMGGKDRCTLLIHPDDASARGVAEGQPVSIASRVGRVQTTAELTVDIMPGVVSLPHGWGHDRKGVQLRTAQAHPGVSVNDLTDELRVDALSGNAAHNGVPVQVVADRPTAHAPTPKQKQAQQ